MTFRSVQYRGIQTNDVNILFDVIDTDRLTTNQIRDRELGPPSRVITKCNLDECNYLLNSAELS